MLMPFPVLCTFINRMNEIGEFGTGVSGHFLLRNSIGKFEGGHLTQEAVQS